MRRPILVVLAFAAVVAVANIGFKLVGAVRQIDTLARASTGSTNATVSVAPRATRAEPAPLVSPAPGAKAAEQTAPILELPLPESEPQVRFDAEAALREARNRDPNVAELLTDPDPAVGSAVREFITGLAPPGGN